MDVMTGLVVPMQIGVSSLLPMEVRSIQALKSCIIGVLFNRD
jgi:hypothetical protein